MSLPTILHHYCNCTQLSSLPSDVITTPNSVTQRQKQKTSRPTQEQNCKREGENIGLPAQFALGFCQFAWCGSSFGTTRARPCQTAQIDPYWIRWTLPPPAENKSLLCVSGGGGAGLTATKDFLFVVVLPTFPAQNAWAKLWHNSWHHPLPAQQPCQGPWTPSRLEWRHLGPSRPHTVASETLLNTKT